MEDEILSKQVDGILDREYTMLLYKNLGIEIPFEVLFGKSEYEYSHKQILDMYTAYLFHPDEKAKVDTLRKIILSWK